MRSVNIPEYYIKSCNKIEYLFPKAHAAAYVTMAVRAAYFKVHHPLAYYATYFTLRSKQYDYEIMLKSPKEIAERLSHYKRLKNESRKRLSPKDADLEVTLMNVLEMKERGYKFLPIDLERSLATDFLIDEARQGIIPPFIVMDGVGENAAHSVVEARQLGPFLSSEDVAKRTKLSSTNINQLQKMKVFEALDAFSTVSLFSFDD
jgi:DNA polymerase-3 subunit alpha (Gram-positive type)